MTSHLLGSKERGNAMTNISQSDQATIKKATQIFKLLSDPNRLKIVTLLSKKALNVSQIAEEAQMEQSATSHQLKILYEGHLLEKTRSGKSIYYRQADSHVFNIIEQVLTHAKEANLNQD